MPAYAVSAMPVLPPLRLNDRAPAHIQLPSIHEIFPEYDRKTPQPHHHTQSPYARPPLRPRQDSVSSSMTSRSSETPSPPPTSQVRIILVSSWDEADFALLVAPSSTNPPTSPGLQKTQPRLLHGHEFAQFKASGYRVPPGARAFPYRSQRVLAPASSTNRPSIAGRAT